jgi:hypothetical protein
VTRADRPAAWRPAGAPLRLVRSVAAALVCVTAAALGHHTAGGMMPPVAVLSVFAGSALVAWLLSARRVTATQIVGLLVLCQLVVHFGASDGEMTMGAAMIAAHLAATTVSVVVLARGEALVWRLADRLVLRAVPLLTALPVVPPARRVQTVTRIRSRRDVRLTHSRVLRGPPVGAV